MIRAVISLMVAALGAWAGEYAVLANGFRLRVDTHEKVGGIVRLHTSGGTIELPSAQVSHFEQEEIVPEAPPSSPSPEDASVKPAISPRELVEEAAKKWGLPPELLHSVAVAESNYRVDAVSPKGAIGVMQLMPGTAAALSADPHDPVQNIDAGARYLREMLIRYDHGLWSALAAYNAGPGAVDRYNGVPPYRETRAYVNKVYRDYQKRAGSKAF